MTLFEENLAQFKEVSPAIRLLELKIKQAFSFKEDIYEDLKEISRNSTHIDIEALKMLAEIKLQ
jgi:hypothetical protein